MPFFSIVIPTYNRASALKVSIESILGQSFKDFEIIVVDDGSVDDTKGVVQFFDNAAIKYIYQENRERSAARNNGMHHASGSYICLLDCGDIFYDQHLQVLYDSIAKDNFPVAIYKTMMHYADKSRPDDLSYSYNGEDRDAAIRYVWNNGSQLICLCFHTVIGNSIQFPEKYFWFEDVHWLIRVVMEYPLIQIRQHTTRYNNENSDSVQTAIPDKYFNNCESCIRNLEQLHGAELKRILGRNCFDVKVAELYLGLMVTWAIKAKQVKAGFSYLSKAIGMAVTSRLAMKYCYYCSKLIKASFSNRWV